MVKHAFLPLAVCLSLSWSVMAATNGRLQLDNAESSDITLYPDKALVKQTFTVLPDNEGTIVLDGFGGDWRESGFSLVYIDGKKRYFPEKLWWRRGGLDRDSIYSKLVGHSVELMGGGINVPVQGELLVYDAGVALVQGNNGRQYVVDWNDAGGVRLASREPLFTNEDYADRMVAEFGEQKPEGKLELSYLTPSLSYTSQYRLMKEGEGKASLERQLILKNTSLTDYKNATIRLVSGDTNSAPVSYMRAMNDEAVGLARSKVNDERVGELLVTPLTATRQLGGHTNVQLTQYKQDNIAIDKQYVLDVHSRSYGSRSPSLERPRTVLRFKAEADLPAGRVELFESQEKGATLLSGSAWLPATVKGDYAKLPMGEALTVRVDRKKIDNQQKGGELRTRWQMTIYNDQKAAVTFVMNDRDRSLLALSDVQEGMLEGTSMIKVQVPARGEKTVMYMATYTQQ